MAFPLRILTFAIRTEMVVVSAISDIRIESIPSSLLKIDPDEISGTRIESSPSSLLKIDPNAS